MQQTAPVAQGPLLQMLFAAQGGPITTFPAPLTSPSVPPFSSAFSSSSSTDLATSSDRATATSSTGTTVASGAAGGTVIPTLSDSDDDCDQPELPRPPPVQAKAHPLVSIPPLQSSPGSLLLGD
eukprot:TRINITY_DN13364_c1_g1_i1.p1 TRINITY_DN13364_c1_g1~~TRINITY_DN13364_c1_g1_i1.p1  ORF type:complete len:124 (+),score=10.79 TRINITY_DN13364_c1_g1_i1:87-458(+)